MLSFFPRDVLGKIWDLIESVSGGFTLVDRKLVEAPPPLVSSLLAVPTRLVCFGSLVILDVACAYLWLFSLYINIKIGTNRC